MTTELVEHAHEFLAEAALRKQVGDRFYVLVGDLKRKVIHARNSARLRRVQQQQRQVVASSRRRRSSRRRTDKYYAHLQKLAQS